ncbi:aspartate aminotransferase [Mycobacteroides saopaulense]|uniref:Aminotransferase n=1 Tax=Mycobacteroides saopaulense TaxID=1578165 RepID=A0A1X0IY94_9MYCO|nr:pyridoxal phosphate-dependent aminotransferase [Mycobacteroides saopaulense]ORB53406.1 aspartate aminotransferase [Mycobacteroides saopaulense]
MSTIMPGGSATVAAVVGLSRRSDVPPFYVMDVLTAASARQRTHGDMISLAAGQPSTGAPAVVLDAVREALGTQVLGYTETLGLPELRAAIAEYHQRSGIEVSADDVVVTTGSSGGFTLLFLAAFDVGDTVVMARPGYPAYRNCLAALGCRVVEIDCGLQTRYQPTVAMLEAVLQADGRAPAGLIVASPANPTGTIIDATELEAIALWCEANGTLLISDEIYHGLSYGDQKTSSAWEFSREAVVMGSVSKYFSMTGWRLGWMLVPRRFLRAVDRLSSNFTICPPAVSQYGALAAFSTEARAELDGHVRRYAANRTLLIDGLESVGITKIAPPDGAFYAYADIERLTDNAEHWCADLLARTGVAIAPGIDFDTVHGHRTIRMSFAGSSDAIEEALRRLGS